MARWTINRCGAAPCQWFSPGSKNTRSPGRITSTGPPSRWQRPMPSVTKIVWPCGWVCQAVRAPGVKWTSAAANVELPAATATASIYTSPVNQSAGPLAVSIELRVICTRFSGRQDEGWSGAFTRYRYRDSKSGRGPVIIGFACERDLARRMRAIPGASEVASRVPCEPARMPPGKWDRSDMRLSRACVGFGRPLSGLSNHARAGSA